MGSLQANGRNWYLCRPNQLRMTLMERLDQTVSYIKSRQTSTPRIGIVLGSGLGNFKRQIRVDMEIPYAEIPHFPVSTVEGHSGTLIFGTIADVPVVAMAGRFHYYEGYSPADVVFPIRVMKFLGVDTLLLSNAAGGVTPGYKVGDVMIIRDHISLSITNPLIGVNEPALGPRFPDMSRPYDPGLIAMAHEIAGEKGCALQEGVYYGVTGPTYETRAEYKMIHILGGDAVGMSTVQEVIVAVHMGMRVFGVSIITDLGIREEENTITHEEVLEAAAAAEPRVAELFTELIRRM